MWENRRVVKRREQMSWPSYQMTMAKLTPEQREAFFDGVLVKVLLDNVFSMEHNYRLAEIGDVEAEKAFEEQKAHGNTLSFETEVEFEGRKFKYGYNYEESSK
jgi:hypothetical protein